LYIRVGGSFTFPPSPEREFRKVVFVAGGVGVNPLVSMVSWIRDIRKSRDGNDVDNSVDVKFLYSTKGESGKLDEVLFYKRIKKMMGELGMSEGLKVFLTSPKGDIITKDFCDDRENIVNRRISHGDLLDALGPVEERKGILCYVCGVPGMTDEFVKVAREAEGMRVENVLCERWW
jgi:NAD(P)H-flavin reductase